MAHEEAPDSEQLADWYSSFEDQCLEDLEAEPNMEETLQAERDYAVQKLWLQFQNSATAIAQLYKDRHHGLTVWIPFQNAASSVTGLYKESVDTLGHCIDLGIQCGHQRRSRDIIAWAKKRRRHIRREELLAFLCGKNPPPRNRLSSGLGRHSQSPRPRHNLERTSPRVSSPETAQAAAEPDLQAFREALALQGLNGAMSNISMGYRPHGPPSPTQLGPLPRNNMEELNSFILEEFSRNCDSRKRTSSTDVKMDSPSRKRSRLI